MQLEKSILGGMLLLSLVACRKEALFQSEILSNIGNEVIVRTYEDVKNKVIDLQTAITTLQASPDSTHLAQARFAWVQARTPWESSEAFLFGPVEQENIDPSIDSWPVNETDMATIINSSTAITAAYLATQESNLHGFHTVEFFLWGTNGSKQAADLTARELEYLGACAELLVLDAGHLYDAWSSSNGNYVANLVNAGDKKSNSIYDTQKDALLDLTFGLITIADELANAKIEEPLSTLNPLYEESRFSDNTSNDFSNNLRSINNIYNGTYNGFGSENGISDIIERTDAALDEQVKAEINAALAAIGDIPGTFTQALLSDPTPIAELQSKVRQLLTTLEDEVLPIIESLK